MSADTPTRITLLKSAPLDSWVALSEDEMRIVAVGDSYMKVSEMSDEAGESDPLILKTPVIWGPMFV
jgi:hypothetical protein